MSLEKCFRIALLIDEAFIICGRAPTMFRSLICDILNMKFYQETKIKKRMVVQRIINRVGGK
jgi:hypothetical protein